jgi:tRNA (cmo5U34)-methyltransferase
MALLRRRSIGEMLGLAKRTLGPLASRVDLHEGDGAPEGPFDAALHPDPAFHPGGGASTHAGRGRRLKPGAPFVVAHHSFPQHDGEKARWLSRYAAFAAASGVLAANAENAISAIGERLPLLSPEQDEALLWDAGFTDVALFYAGFTFRGWVAYKA